MIQEARKPNVALQRLAARMNPPRRRAPRYGRMVTEEATGGDADNLRALQSMRQLWSAAGGFFPGAKTMPAPDFFPGPIGGGRAVDAWTELEPDGPLRGSHVAWPSAMSRALARQGRGAQQGKNDDAEATLLHEWAHMFQRPDVLADERLREAGAEALARALMPKVARRSGRRYSPLDPTYSLAAALQRGSRFIFRGQFGA